MSTRSTSYTSYITNNNDFNAGPMEMGFPSNERELVDVRALVLSGLAPLARHGARRQPRRRAALLELAQCVIRQLVLHQVHTVHATVLVTLLALAAAARAHAPP